MFLIITDVKKFRKPTHEIDDIFINRWSPRSFSEQKIPKDILLSLFEAARWAPSAFNIQPWRFIIAHTKESREKFYSFISESNLSWCKKAPVLTLIISEKENDRGENRSHSFDAGTAWGFLSLQAIKCGLITHPMSGFDFEKARKVLEIPDNYEIQACIAIGYQSDRENLPKQLQEREEPNGRRPLEESIFDGEFGKTF